MKDVGTKLTDTIKERLMNRRTTATTVMAITLLAIPAYLAAERVLPGPPPWTTTTPDPVQTTIDNDRGQQGDTVSQQITGAGSSAAADSTYPVSGACSSTKATTRGHNGLIVFSSSTPGGTQLFTVRPNGEDLTQITHVAGDAVNADWAPDGRHIVFSVGKYKAARIAIVRADGAGLRTLPQAHGVFDDQPSYSPDGSRIYFERYTAATNDDAIGSMATDGTDARRILGPFPNGFVTDPNISPDGRTMSFQRWDGTVTDSPPNLQAAQSLFTATLCTGRVSQIGPFTSNQTTMAGWAPNGWRIAVTENANHYVSTRSANIATMRPDGSGLKHLTNFNDSQTNAYFGSYSPDGQWLVYRLEDHGLFGLYRMHPDGSHQQAIISLSTLRPSLINWGTQPEDQK